MVELTGVRARCGRVSQMMNREGGEVLYEKIF